MPAARPKPASKSPPRPLAEGLAGKRGARRSSPRPSPRTSPRRSAEIRASLADLQPIDELAAVFASLGSAPRLRLLYLLYHRPELKVTELAELAGLSVSGVSMHLQKLRGAGLVRCRRDRQSICCTLPSSGEHIRFVGQIFRRIAEQTGCCC